MNDHRNTAIKTALVFVEALIACTTVQANTMGIQQTLNAHENAYSTFVDGSGNYRWQPHQGHSTTSTISFELDQVLDAPLRVFWRQRKTIHEGVVGRYQCLIMCAWFSNGIRNPNDPYHRLNYRMDTLAVERPNWLSWQPSKTIELGITPRISLHAVKGAHSGEAGVFARQYGATIGTDIGVKLQLGQRTYSTLKWRWDGIATPQITLNSDGSELAIAHWIDLKWGWNFAIKRTSTKVSLHQGHEAWMTEKLTAASVALIVRW